MAVILHLIGPTYPLETDWAGPPTSPVSDARCYIYKQHECCSFSPPILISLSTTRPRLSMSSAAMSPDDSHVMEPQHPVLGLSQPTATEDLTGTGAPLYVTGSESEEVSRATDITVGGEPDPATLPDLNGGSNIPG